MLLSYTSQPFTREGWVYEFKYDGYRLLAELDHGTVRLQTRGGADATGWFPEVVAGLATVPGGVHILDGEVCVLDEIGRSDFDRLHARAMSRRYTAGAAPAAYCVFDILVKDGQSVMDQPLLSRRAMLRELLSSKPDSVLVVSFVEDGTWLYEQAQALRMEGVVAKRADSLYVPGGRTRDWVKIKRPGHIKAQRFQRG